MNTTHDESFIEYFSTKNEDIIKVYSNIEPYSETEELFDENIDNEFILSSEEISDEMIEDLLYSNYEVIPAKVAINIGAISEEEKDAILNKIFQFKKRYKKAILMNFNIRVENIHQEIIDYIEQGLFERIKHYFYKKHFKYTLEMRYEKLLKIIIANLYNAYYYRYFLMVNRSDSYYSNIEHKDKIKVVGNKGLFSVIYTTKIFDSLTNENLLLMKKGFHSYDYRQPNMLTRYFPQNDLLKFFQTLLSKKKSPISVDNSYSDYSDESVLLRDIKHKNQKKGKVIDNIIENGIFPKNNLSYKRETLKRIKNEVITINKFLRDVDIRILNPVTTYDKFTCAYYYSVRRLILKLEKNHFLMLDEAKRLIRIFNDCDIMKGGRLYGPYQQFSSATRKNLLMNDEEVELLDIKGSHISMLYHFCDIQYDDDPYELLYNLEVDTKNRCKHVRKMNKLFLQILINSNSRKSAVNAAHRKGLLKYSKVNRLTLRDKLEQIVKEKKLKKMDLVSYWLTLFENKHELIKDYFFSGIGVNLQYIESKLMINSMLQLLEKGIPSLPVHDELIVPYSKRDIAKRILENNYKTFPELKGHDIVIEYKSDHF